MLKLCPTEADEVYRRFSDVSLLCERIGVTQLPISNKKIITSRSDGLSELSGRAKKATTGRRAQSIKARNLYRVGASESGKHC